MGGGDHGHGRPYEIPDWKIYKVEDVPELRRVQDMLAQKGLKDPWLRNEVWRYHPSMKTYWRRVGHYFGRGLPYGLGAAAVTIIVTELFGLGPSHGDHGHGEGHH